MAIQLSQLLKVMVENGASDLHITTNSPPVIRVDGQLVPIKHPPLTPPRRQKIFATVF